MAKKVEMFVSEYDGTVYRTESEANKHDAHAPLRQLLEEYWADEIAKSILSFLISEKYGDKIIDILVKIRQLPNAG